jgi:monofunctional biosynthetic peptidoglycan transglycosylase
MQRLTRKLVHLAAWTLAGMLAAFLAVQLWFLAHIWWWKDHPPAATSFMEHRIAELRAGDPGARLKHVWVPYTAISTELKRAVIVAEDAKFADHEGFDWEGIQKALEKNQKKGKLVAGGSTISQQLAKNLFLSGEKSWWRKGEEAIITAMLEATMDKQRIFEIYLNVVEWGNGVFGAEAAARHHFGRNAASLSDRQAALLAAMLPNPRRFEKNRESPYMQQRVEIILSRMPQAQLP